MESVLSIPKSNKKYTKKKTSDQYHTSMNTDTKIFNKILAKRIQQYIKENVYHDQVEVILGMQCLLTFKNQSIHHIKRQKNFKNHIIISTNVKKAFDKIQYHSC